MGRAESNLIVLALLSGWAASSITTGALAETAAPAKGIAFSGLTTLTTDYVYRGISLSAEHPAIQGYMEATHKRLYLGLWGSSVDLGAERNRAGNLQDVADLELGLSGGVRPQWKGIDFDLGVFYYAYPGSLQSADLDYVEFDAGASYAVSDRLSLHGEVWWSPDEGENNGELDGIEVSASYDLKQIWFVSPTVSALYGSQWGEGNDETYAYWNAGLTLGVSQKPALSFDIRYWDTDLKDCIDAAAYQCGPRVVGSLSASF